MVPALSLLPVVTVAPGTTVPFHGPFASMPSGLASDCRHTRRQKLRRTVRHRDRQAQAERELCECKAERGAFGGLLPRTGHGRRRQARVPVLHCSLAVMAPATGPA